MRQETFETVVGAGHMGLVFTQVRKRTVKT